MTAKEYLDQAYHLDKLIESYSREAAYWREKAHSIQSAGFGRSFNPNHPTEAPFIRSLEKADEKKRRAAEKYEELERLMNEMDSAIEMLEDRDEQLLLRYRYIENKTWDEIARKLNISLRTVHRIHGSALRNFKVPKEDTEPLEGK